MPAYLYLFYANGGDLAGLTLLAGSNDAAALGEARRFLADRDDVRLVEVWRDACLVAQAGT